MTNGWLLTVHLPWANMNKELILAPSPALAPTPAPDPTHVPAPAPYPGHDHALTPASEGSKCCKLLN